MNTIITGGAGFIGTNLAAHLLDKGENVTIFDNLSRKGTEINLAWLQKKYPQMKFVKGDLREFETLKELLKDSDVVYHLAGQVAVTTSVTDPRNDFEVNLLGTFNVLEAARAQKKPPVIVYSSTNKVYGDLADLEIAESDTRYIFKDTPNGVTEKQPLDFHSPYGCSKGSADQYVRDYARIYNIPTIVFRQSCIYGPHQFGIEDQGWVAWFAIASMLGKPITVYGNGKQTRDILYVNDLCKAYTMAVENISKTKGEIYNIGGGLEQSISVWYEFREILEKELKTQLQPSFSDTRPGDQPLFISDNAKAKKDFGWEPTTAKIKGIQNMINWIRENLGSITKVFQS